MSWSKVKKGKKPLGWWYHKILCEFWYSVNNDKRYYRHLNIMCDKYGITLYGENIDDFDISPSGVVWWSDQGGNNGPVN